MPAVVIIGNSGAARECYWLLQDMMAAAPGLKNYYTFRGFAGWNHHQAHLESLEQYNLGDASKIVLRDELLVIGIAEPAVRKEVFEHYKAQGATFLTLVHPWSDINPAAQIGEGNIFQRGSTVFCDTHIGNANYFNGAINIAHDVRVGNYNFIGPASLILGQCQLGSENMLGAHTTVLPSARIGDGNSIAPGSIVYKGCKSHCRMAGNPALKVGEYRSPHSEVCMESMMTAPVPARNGAESVEHAVTAIFPLKGQSERVPRKNLRPFCGKPLFLWALTELASCPSITRIIVDTDSEEKIARHVEGMHKVCVHERPVHLWGNHVSMNQVLDWVVTHDSQHAGHYLQSHATNPLLSQNTVENAIATYFSGLNTHDSLFSVTELHTRLYDSTGSAMNHDPAVLSNTQDLPPIFEENSNLYIFSQDSFVKAGRKRIGLFPQMYIMSKYEAFDIDTEEDFKLAEATMFMLRNPVAQSEE